MPSHTIINGDCLTELKRLPDNSVHLAILDLPYGNTALKWDKQVNLAGAVGATKACACEAD